MDGFELLEIYGGHYVERFLQRLCQCGELEWSALALQVGGFRGFVRFVGGGMLLCRERVFLGLPPAGEAKKDGGRSQILFGSNSIVGVR
jgi:hypothetical protein